MPFQTKKIKTETLAEYLRGSRKQLKFSLEQVSESTGVSMKFLEFLETGKYASLPPTVYAAGFLKKIAKLYHVPNDSLITQFKKERALSVEISKGQTKALSFWSRMLGRFVVTPKSLSLSAGLLFVVVTVGYIIFQVLSIYGTPKLAIQEPQDGQKISSSSVQVTGRTDPGVTLTINDQPVFVEASNGSFHTVVSVAGGQKDLLFVASNKFNKTNTKTISLLVDPKTSDAKAPPANGQGSSVKLVLQFTDTADIVVAADDQPAISETAAAGTSRTIVAKNKIVISTSNAGATLAQLNNKSLGPLGKKNESLTGIPFSADTADVIVSAKKIIN